MKPRPPRKKKCLDLPSAAYQALKKSVKPLSLKDLYTLVENSLADKYELSLSALHTELNLDGRFIFLSDRTWALKSKVPNLKRQPLDDFDLLEVEYEPVKEDYEWNKDNEDDDDDDDSELLVPYDGDDMELIEDDDSPTDDENEDDDDEYNEDDDDYPEKGN